MRCYGYPLTPKHTLVITGVFSFLVVVFLFTNKLHFPKREGTVTETEDSSQALDQTSVQQNPQQEQTGTLLGQQNPQQEQTGTVLEQQNRQQEQTGTLLGQQNPQQEQTGTLLGQQNPQQEQTGTLVGQQTPQQEQTRTLSEQQNPQQGQPGTLLGQQDPQQGQQNPPQDQPGKTGQQTETVSVPLHRRALGKGDREISKDQYAELLTNFIHNVQGTSARDLNYLSSDDLMKFRTSAPTDLRYAKLDEMSAEDMALTVHSVMDNTNVICNRRMRMGDLDDGGWEVCDDEDVRLSPPCIVYSFGVGYDWSFDDVISRIYGCHVYSFDPSLGMENFNRSDLVHFYNVGVSSHSHTTSKGWNMKTFQELRAMLGHSDTKIDLIKMDIEGSEWETIHDMLETNQFSGSKQLLLEFHVHANTKSYLLPKLKDVQQLELQGYKKFHSNKNYNCIVWVKGFPIQRTICYEVHYLFRS